MTDDTKTCFSPISHLSQNYNFLSILRKEALTYSLYPVSWYWGQLHAQTFALMKLLQTESSRLKCSEILSLLFFLPLWCSQTDGGWRLSSFSRHWAQWTWYYYFSALWRSISVEEAVHSAMIRRLPLERWVESISWFWLKTPDEPSESTWSLENAATELSTHDKKDNCVQADNC